jgi:hypothetical protein
VRRADSVDLRGCGRDPGAGDRPPAAGGVSPEEPKPSGSRLTPARS